MESCLQPPFSVLFPQVCTVLERGVQRLGNLTVALPFSGEQKHVGMLEWASPSSALVAESVTEIMETIRYVLAPLMEYQKEVEVLSDAAVVITLLLTSCALIFTGWQICRNISQTRAATVYAIQKDARAFLFELEKQPEVMKSLFSQEIDESPQVQNRIGSIFNLYAAIHQQRRLRVLDARTWRGFENELRVFVRSATAQSFWSSKRQSAQYNKAYSTLIDRLIVEETTSKGTNASSNQRSGERNPAGKG